ncbi:Hsp20/alpha crystallin family protein [Virgibacillus sp. 179-BFC.A HS]|uniref:Hsp20/alpha crystallin family protein n=1 Tax=Tigheibacillus jepli TaxID=3035914 RepID=A0ABU5CF92_9BACI|nr:Hsp20/alpha crystallin family protein [Virgibacillus sp. 179-BFC.A HS]MDY0404983.1 Hsp20/alpha crystallin family protein [Virgibacillus sp. 179-BFC.A HS]
MDIEQLKQWMELAQKYQSGNFWDTIFDQYMTPPNQTAHHHRDTHSNAHTNTMEQNVDEHTNEPRTNNGSAFPPVDIFVTETQITVIIELPGLRKEDIQLSLSGNQLLIKGTHKVPIVSDSTLLNERRYGKFERMIELPEPAQSKDIQARFEDGLLLVIYPRKYSQHEKINIL